MTPARADVLKALGGEDGCRRISCDFYARVAKDPILRRLFPGKSQRCAIEQFAAFLIQFLGGNEEQTQLRWWLSLRESHGRFEISRAERAAWLQNMNATLAAATLDEETRAALGQFFFESSAYVAGNECAQPEHAELAARWTEQRALDDAIAAIAAGRDGEALALGARFVSRPAVFVGLLARMMKDGRGPLVSFVIAEVRRQPSLARQRFYGRTLLHFAAAAGCCEAAKILLQLGSDPNRQDQGGHGPLYCLANECAANGGPELVRMLVGAGADVNACGGVTKATPLHMAARRGHLGIARALLEAGAAWEARDRKGVTPLQRATSCRQETVRQLLLEWSAGRRIG